MDRATSEGNEAAFRYAHVGIRTRVVVICGSTSYQLDHTQDLISIRVEIYNGVDHLKEDNGQL